MSDIHNDAKDLWFNSYPNIGQLYLWAAISAIKHGDNVNDAIKAMNVVIEKVMDNRMKQ